MRLRQRLRQPWLLAVPCLFVAGPLLAATYQVSLIDDEFVPKTLVIAPGDTVVWTNTTGSAHTVVADDSSFSSTPSGPFIPFGETYTFTFPNVGRNPYYCLLHGGPGGQDMAGVIRVVDPGLNYPPATPTPVAPVAGAVNLSVAPTLTASTFADSDDGDTHAASQWLIRDGTTGAVTDTGEDIGRKISLPLTGLTFSTSYFWKVRYRDDRGAWSEYSPEVGFTTVAEQSVAGTGLFATYARYLAATARKPQKITPIATNIDPKIDFDWKLLGPFAKVPKDHFYVSWEGTLLPECSERYRFWVRADGGVKLWINGQVVIDDWVVGKFAIYRNGLVNLAAGVPSTIKVEYFDTTSAASINLRWSSFSRTLEVIPQTRLFPLTP